MIAFGTYLRIAIILPVNKTELTRAIDAEIARLEAKRLRGGVSSGTRNLFAADDAEVNRYTYHPAIASAGTD
jgi:hypothetical protein